MKQIGVWLDVACRNIGEVGGIIRLAADIVVVNVQIMVGVPVVRVV